MSLSKPLRLPSSFSHLCLLASRARKPLHHSQIRDISCTTVSRSQKTENENDTSPGYLYEPIEAVEILDGYRKGGYHPIAIGDQLHDRYRVVHKLGHGAYSTIWLAQDRKVHRYVALKVCIAGTNPLEVSVLSELSNSQRCPSRSFGRTMIPWVLDRFNIQGINGTHACYVTDAGRVSLSDAKNGSYNGLFQLEVARALAAQLVIAVEYVHCQGFVRRPSMWKRPPPATV